MRPNSRAAGKVLLLAALFPLVADCLPIVLKANPLSISLGAVYKNPFDDKGLVIKVLDWAVGTRVNRNLGFGLGAVTFEYFENHNQVPIEVNPFFGLVAESYVFVAPSLREHPHSLVGYGHFALDLWDTPKNFRLGLGINSTLWALNPELEIDWVREYPCSFYPKTTDYLALRLRLGLGGWYELCE